MSTAVALRRWPLRVDIAASLPVAALFEVDLNAAKLHLTRKHGLESLPDRVQGWFTALDGVEVAFAILGSDRALLKVGVHTFLLDPSTTVSHHAGAMCFRLSLRSADAPSFTFSYPTHSGGVLRRLAGLALRFVDGNEAVDADPLATLAMYSRSGTGFGDWLSSLQPSSGAYRSAYDPKNPPKPTPPEGVPEQPVPPAPTPSPPGRPSCNVVFSSCMAACTSRCPGPPLVRGGVCGTACVIVFLICRTGGGDD
jgi:hypothetical protein